MKYLIAYPIVNVLGEGVDKDHLAGGCSPIQADGGVKVSVPKHGAAQQSDQHSDDQHRQQGDEPAQHGYTCGTGQITNIAPT